MSNEEVKESKEPEDKVPDLDSYSLRKIKDILTHVMDNAEVQVSFQLGAEGDETFVAKGGGLDLETYFTHNKVFKTDVSTESYSNSERIRAVMSWCYYMEDLIKMVDHAAGKKRDEELLQLTTVSGFSDAVMNNEFYHGIGLTDFGLEQQKEKGLDNG